MTIPESKNIELAIEALEVLIKGWDDPAIPADHAVLGVKRLKKWKEEISSNSSEEQEEGKQEI